jgi:hypothetical protein
MSSGKKMQKARRKNQRGDDTTLVPWKHVELTDRMTLPSRVSTTYSTIKSYTTENVLAQSATVQTFIAAAFNITTIDSDFASAANIFDQYRILGVEVTLNPHSTAPSSVAPSAGQLVTVIDYDDGTALTNLNQALAYANAITTPVNQAQRRCFKPRIALAAYSGAFTSFANFPAQWIDCASGTVQHYGFKAAMDIGIAGSLQVFDLLVRAHVEFRSTR